jgi:hypothetical protein
MNMDASMFFTKHKFAGYFAALLLLIIISIVFTNITIFTGSDFAVSPQNLLVEEERPAVANTSSSMQAIQASSSKKAQYVLQPSKGGSAIVKIKDTPQKHRQ